MNDLLVDGVLPAATILYNWDENALEVANPYPSAYGNKKRINDEWNTFAYREVPYTINDKEEIVSSFPASDSLVVYNIHTGKYISYFAGYSEETNIKPHVPISKTDGLRNYLEQYQYSSVLYDVHHQLYYRLVVLPLMDYDLNDVLTQQKGLAIIVLNNRYEKVGEYLLAHERYMYINSFVSPEGLCVNYFSDDDDYLKFKIWKPIKHEK